jgi:hypothetical protein
MTNEQYEKLVELVDSIEFIDKELIDTNKFIAKFYKIFSKDYEAPTIYPWTNTPGVRDIETPKTPFYDPIKIMYYGTGTGDPKIMYDGPGTGDNKVMYDGPPEYAPFYGINYFDTSDKTNGVDGMKITVNDDNTHSNTYRNTKSTNEVQCVEDVDDQEPTLQSKYTDPKNLDTV